MPILDYFLGGQHPVNVDERYDGIRQLMGLYVWWRVDEIAIELRRTGSGSQEIKIWTHTKMPIKRYLPDYLTHQCIRRGQVDFYDAEVPGVLSELESIAKSFGINVAKKK